MEKIIIYKDEEFWTNKENFEKLYKIGKIKENKLILEPEEVLYLLEKEKIIVKKNNFEIKDLEEFLKIFKEKINYKIFLVIKYLREIGYYFDIQNEKIIIHAKGERNNPIYLCLPLLEFEELTWDDILKYLDEAKKIGAKLLLAIIDIENDIVFYEISEIRF